MSISVDDLISSFSSSHIGQEAMDLAQLQAQLSESLFGANMPSSSRRGRDYQPCNTPTARTPTSSSFNWESLDAKFAGQSRSRSSSISSRMEDMEDELMVEELLMPTPSSSSVFENGNHNTYSSFSSSGSFVQPSSSYSSSSFHQSQSSSSSRTFSEGLPSSPSQSLFASTDPFFLQAQANAQSYFCNNSNITQRGRPSQSSPFVQASAFHNHSYHHNHFAATAAAF
ncbi:hypothetical protein CC2G_010917 [Coprinopsis cinerea AmutBmut pab1-1]|nr:hypothetical protein CC2G_010917 [Coprinopsis cinerea AmutBmut pab1-1]